MVGLETWKPPAWRPEQEEEGGMHSRQGPGGCAEEGERKQGGAGCERSRGSYRNWGTGDRDTDRSRMHRKVWGGAAMWL